ncbi:hypothetical protein LJC44_07280, partial [Parabacteroides sp. OttesenSCG-928-G06]|nr:hypothetical protein [Parabacteroides sp. OttesenSCG-928-G06]
MKRAFTLLFLAVVLIYGKTWLSVHSFASSLQGVLSDVAEEVRAIPLENAGGNAINNAVQVKQEGSNLFLISDHVLYRYNNNGRFICRITHPAVMEARMYVVDPLRKELIVFGNDHDVHYYDYQGNLLDSKELDRGEEGFRRIYSMNWHNDRLFSIEENTYINPDTQQIDIQKEVVTYDRSMQKIDARPLCAVDLGRPRNNMYDLIDSQLCLDPDTGRLIVYNPASIPDYLPEDTLYLRRNWETQLAVASANNSVPVVPIRPAGRF